MPFSRSEIREAAVPLYRQWVREHVRPEPGPVPIQLLISRLGINIDWHRFTGPDVLGFCFNRQITINSALPLRRRRFTLAHELKHVLWDPPTSDPILCLESDANRVIEIEANIFASELMWPYDPFMRSLNLLDNVELSSVVQILSDIYQMSLSGTAWRLVDLGRISHTEAERLIPISSPPTPPSLKQTAPMHRSALLAPN